MRAKTELTTYLRTFTFTGAKSDSADTFRTRCPECGRTSCWGPTTGLFGASVKSLSIALSSALRASSNCCICLHGTHCHLRHPQATWEDTHLSSTYSASSGDIRPFRADPGRLRPYRDIVAVVSRGGYSTEASGGAMAAVLFGRKACKTELQPTSLSVPQKTPKVP